jgi:DNA processing protein
MSAPEGSASALPPLAWVVALAQLPEMGPARLTALLDRWSPEHAWAQVQAGTCASAPAVAAACRYRKLDPVPLWQAGAASCDVGRLWEQHQLPDLAIGWRGDGGIPAPLAEDVEPPAVLFHRGALEALDGPRVAIVGTRRCTRYGRDVAFDLGLDLTAAGVRVVSGLASGIDAAAHRGSLASGAAPPVGVVGTGLDVVYPRSSADLWRDVAQQGLLLTEAPLSAPAARWRFPARNRLVAALADAVVVVESSTKGGSMYTVEEALRRDRPVLAVPGSVRSPVSAGTNALLAEGAPVCRDAADVLALLDLSVEPSRRTARPAVAAPDGDAGLVLDAVGWEPAETSGLALRTGLDLGRLSLALDQLEAAGWIARSGAWIERVRT